MRLLRRALGLARILGRFLACALALLVLAAIATRDDLWEWLDDGL